MALLTLDKIEAEYRQKRAQFEAQKAILGQLPLRGIIPDPDFIHLNKSGLPHHVIYCLDRKEPHSLEVACDAIYMFGPLHPVSCSKNPSFTSVYPGVEPPNHLADGQVQWTCEEGIVLRQHNGPGYSSAELEIYPRAVTPVTKIGFRVVLPPSLQSRIVVKCDRHGNPIPGTEEPDIRRLSMHSVLYGTGGRSSIDYVSVFDGIYEMRRNLLGEP